MEHLHYSKAKKNLITGLLYLAVIIAWISGFITGKYLPSYSEPLDPKCDTIELNLVYPPDTTHLVLATTYNTTVAQCDSTPNKTADGSYIDPVKLRNKEIRWVALSRDLIWDDYRQTIFEDTTHWRGDWEFGDTIEVYSSKFPHLDGEWVVHDCKSDSCKMSIDFLMDPLNNRPKLGLGRDVKIISCATDQKSK